VHVLLRQRRGGALSNVSAAPRRGGARACMAAAAAKFEMTKITFCVSRGNLHTSENTRKNAQS
jgi:hypothetical protein